MRQTFRAPEAARCIGRFEGKRGLNARLEFSERAAMTFLLMAEIDEAAFGDAGVQFEARF